MKLNRTPVRTTRNFNINNITIEDLKFPTKLNSFKNIEFINEDNIKIDDNVSEFNPTYGLGHEITNYTIQNSNTKLRINIDDIFESDLQIIFDFDENNTNLLENIEIYAQKNSKATIILKYKNKHNLEYFHSGSLHLIAHENANLNIIIVNLLNDISNNFMSIENTLSDSANVNYYMIEFGGKYSVTNYYSNQKGDLSRK